MWIKWARIIFQGWRACRGWRSTWWSTGWRSDVGGQGLGGWHRQLWHCQVARPIWCQDAQQCHHWQIRALAQRRCALHHLQLLQWWREKRYRRGPKRVPHQDLHPVNIFLSRKWIWGRNYCFCFNYFQVFTTNGWNPHNSNLKSWFCVRLFSHSLEPSSVVTSCDLRQASECINRLSHFVARWASVLVVSLLIFPLNLISTGSIYMCCHLWDDKDWLYKACFTDLKSWSL